MKNEIVKDKKATVYITTGGNLFTEEELKKYELPQTKQIEAEERFGVEVIPPPYDLLKLMAWLDISVTHNSCVRVKVNDCFGVGWDLKEVEGQEPTDEQYAKLKAFFSKVNENEDIISVSKKVGLDWEACGNGYFEVVRGLTEEEGIKALYHIPATTVRVCKDKQRYVQIVGLKKVYFKPFGEERILNKETGNFVKEVSKPELAANEIIQLKQYTYKSAVYGLPEWLPALFPMYGEQKEKEYNLEFFSSYGVPAYAVVLEGIEVTDDVRKEIQKYFETELKGNPHRTLIMGAPQGGTFRFERLSVDQKEASFRVYRRDNRDDILTAHHVPPYRASIVQQGQLGGSVAEDTDRIYLDSVVNPRQRDFNWVINRFIKEAFLIETLEFEYLDVDIRDKKGQAEVDALYFNMGAMTANELLLSQGKEPYEGGDVYYVPAGLVPIGVSTKMLGEKKDGDVTGTHEADGRKNLPVRGDNRDYRKKKVKKS